MPAAAASWQGRVLLANLDPLVRVGVGDVLANGAEVVARSGDDESLVASTLSFDPDVIVVGGSAGDATTAVSALRAAAPRAKVLVLASDESELLVFDPGSGEPRRIAPADPKSLVSELNDRQPPEERE